MAQVESSASASPGPPPAAAPVPARRAGTSPIVKGLALLALGVLVAFIVVEGRILYAEWRHLEADMVQSRGSVVVGYLNITPNPSFAEKPDNWLHDEGNQTLLWAGWRDGQHAWFRVAKGDLTHEHLKHVFGTDAIQAIDFPIIEQGGGERWEKIPDEALVAGIERKGVYAVYPLRVLEKVEVINDVIGEVPALVTYTPFVKEQDAISVFDPTLAGKRVTMGLSGYFFDNKPLLYDRGTRSLWVGRDDALVCVAGAHKGATLPRVTRLVPTPWSDWRSRHPESRLIVGADRSKGKPEL